LFIASQSSGFLFLGEDGHARTNSAIGETQFHDIALTSWHQLTQPGGAFEPGRR
jgi:hypothetical protein